MITLDLLGALDRCKTFDKSKYSRERIKNIFLISKHENSYFSEIIDLSKKKNQRQLIKSLKTCIRRSNILRVFVIFFKFIMQLPKMWWIREKIIANFKKYFQIM